MKYKPECLECGYGIEDKFYDSEEEAEHEALRHYAEDHGYLIHAFYSEDLMDSAWVKQ